MRRFAVLLCLLLAACTAARITAPGSVPARAQLPGRGGALDYGHQIVRLDYEYDQEGYVEGITIWHGDSTMRHLSMVVTPPESETPTNTPTNTPTLIPTNTPRPTITSTPPPVPTETPRPTPTPERTTQPTPAATAIPKACELRAKSGGVNIRTGAGTTYSIVGSWQAGQYRTFDQFIFNPGGYAWGHSITVPAGWSVIYNEADFSWWVDGTPEADLCYDVPGWNEYVMPPEPIARNLLGFHLIVGTNDSFIALGGTKIGGAKGTTHTQPLLNELKAVNPNAVTIYRSLHNANGMTDCPLDWEWFSPEVYYAKLKPFLEPGNDFYEYMNECSIPLWADGSGNWAQWEKFTLAMLTMFAQDGQCALFGSFGPGGPDIPGWPYVVNVMRWIDEHPCQPGRFHGWATHTTLPMPAWVSVDPRSYIRNPWIIDRDIKFRDWALANTGYDLARFKGGVYVTEGGWSNYSTIADRDFSCEEVAAGWKMTEAEYKTYRPWIRLVALWTLTRDGDPSWYNLQPCLPLLFQ